MERTPGVKGKALLCMISEYRLEPNPVPVTLSVTYFFFLNIHLGSDRLSIDCSVQAERLVQLWAVSSLCHLNLTIRLTMSLERPQLSFASSGSFPATTKCLYVVVAFLPRIMDLFGLSQDTIQLTSLRQHGRFQSR